jgi:hypothetical protein
MSKNVLFISDAILIERTTVHGNIDPKLLYPEIKVAQDMYILPLLGSALFNKLQLDIEAGTLSGMYKTLVDDYIVDTLINYTMMELPTTISFQMFNKGVVRASSADGEVLSPEENLAISERYKRRAEWYAERTKRYLIEESSKGNFPEYINPGSTADTVFPYGGTFTLPIYLGEGDCYEKKGWEHREYISKCR